MIISNKALGLIMFLSTAILTSTPIIADDKEKYSLGVFPYNSARQMISAYGPVAKDLGVKINATIKLKTASSFKKFTQNLEREIYDIALIQPFDYPDAIDKYNYVPIARIDASLSAYFVVLEDSEIKSLSDLRNKTIAFPPPPAAISHLAKAELLDAGINPNKDVKIKHQKNHDSCLHEVLIHRASACPTDFSNIKIFEANRKIKFRILKQTKKLPHILFVGHKRIPQEVLTTLKNQMISWRNTNNGKSILKKIGMPGFIHVKNNDYNIMYTLKKPGKEQPNHSHSNALSLGIFPYIPAKKLAIRMKPLPAAFANALHHEKINFRTASSYDQFNKNIENGIYDIVLMQPFDYQTAKKQGYKPLAQISYDVQATIYVNKDSNIKSFNDLKGQTVASAPWHAAVSRLFNEKVRQSGLWVGKNIFIDYKTSHFECFKQLKDKKAAACISGPLVLASVPHELSENVRLLEKTHAVPGILFMVHSRMEEEHQLELKNEILNWHKHPAGKKLLKHSRLKHFREVDVERYEAMPTL